MRRTRVEIHIHILKVLARFGPLKLAHIMYEANVSSNVLRKYLDFLIQQGIVEKKTSLKGSYRTRVGYAITERGRIVLECFREVNNALEKPEETNDHARTAQPLDF